MMTHQKLSELIATTSEQDGPSLTPWERITFTMIGTLRLEEVLAATTQGLVDEFGAAFARIWLIRPGDICTTCFKADICAERSHCLHLRASSGLSTNLNGEHRRVPLGMLKIGHIAHTGQPVCINDIMNDDRIPNKQWLQDNGLRSFAGYPLVFQGTVLGVLAMFRKEPMSSKEFRRLAAFAYPTAIAIKTPNSLRGLKS